VSESDTAKSTSIGSEKIHPAQMCMSLEAFTGEGQRLKEDWSHVRTLFAEQGIHTKESFF
jgi:hypothetical protein